MLRDFDFQIADPINPMTQESYLTLFTTNLWMRVTSRHEEEVRDSRIHRDRMP